MIDELKKCLELPENKLNVLVAYDNLRAGIMAKDFCDQLAQRLATTCDLCVGFWSLAAVQIPALNQTVIEEAAGADLLIVAVNGDEPLPKLVKRSLIRCLHRMRSHSGALAAQLHNILRMDQELSPTYVCLKQLAHESGVDFFSEVVEPLESDFEQRISRIHERARMSASILAEALQKL